MYRIALFAVCVVAIGACGESPKSAVPPDAQRVADALTGDSSDNAVCRLFTPDELEKYAGEPLESGSSAAMGSGCQWLAKDGDGDVLIQIVPKDYHQKPSLAEGYKELPDVGTEGNVSPALGGWIAAAIVGEESIVASVAGASASAQAAESLLQATIQRRAP